MGAQGGLALLSSACWPSPISSPVPPPKLILGGGPNTPLHPQEEPSCLAHPGTSQDQRCDSTYVSRCRGPTAPYGHGARAPTLRRVPFAPVESARSLPAKSTRLILLT